MSSRSVRGRYVLVCAAGGKCGYVMLGEELGRQLVPGRDAELRVDRLDVVFDGVAGDVKYVGNFLVRKSANQKPRDLALARAEPVELETERGHLEGTRGRQ